MRQLRHLVASFLYYKGERVKVKSTYLRLLRSITQAVNHTYTALTSIFIFRKNTISGVTIQIAMVK